jgi:hypothetical protein
MYVYMYMYMSLAIVDDSRALKEHYKHQLGAAR